MRGTGSPAMSFVIGNECKLYRNSGSYASPTWLEIENVKDLSYTSEAQEADLTTRANNGYTATVATLKSISVNFGMVYDPDDVDYAALETAYDAKDVIEIAICDGPIGTTGTKGIRLSTQIFSFGQDQALTEGVTVPVTMKTTYSSNAPSRFTI